MALTYWIDRATRRDIKSLIGQGLLLSSIFLLIPLFGNMIAIALSGLKDLLVLTLIFMPFWLIGIAGTTYNLGRLWGFFPSQPKNIGTWVAKRKGKIIARADIRYKAGYSLLETLYVAPNFRGQKIGTSLVRRLILEENKPLYVRSPYKTIEFYKNLDFMIVPHEDLPTDLRTTQSRGRDRYMVLL